MGLNLDLFIDDKIKKITYVQKYKIEHSFLVLTIFGMHENA